VSPFITRNLDREQHPNYVFNNKTPTNFILLLRSRSVLELLISDAVPVIVKKQEKVQLLAPNESNAVNLVCQTQWLL